MCSIISSYSVAKCLLAPFVKINKLHGFWSSMDLCMYLWNNEENNDDAYFIYYKMALLLKRMVYNHANNFVRPCK